MRSKAVTEEVLKRFSVARIAVSAQAWMRLHVVVRRKPPAYLFAGSRTSPAPMVERGTGLRDDSERRANVTAVAGEVVG
jgi:hypothetical protein